jgi:hypothetical protein
MRSPIFTTIAITTLLSSSSVFASDTISIEMKDGKFNPSVISVPVHQKVELFVKNAERAEVEFESYELDREVKIPSGETARIFVGPLEAGMYPVFDDNNPDAKGSVVAK